VPILTYLDSGVLIWAATGRQAESARARPFLVDPNRQYVTSDYVRLEVLPKAIFHKNKDEKEIYETFFGNCIRVIPTSIALLEQAMDEASRTGLSGFDALHVMCAVFGGAEEFITTEKLTKPIHRTKLVRVVSIRP